MNTKQTTAIILAFLTAGTSQITATELTITRSGGGVVLTWPLAATNEFYLQSAASLLPPIEWKSTSDPTTNGADLVVTNDGASTSGFFRLQAWETLFDGNSTAAFRGYRQADFPGTNQWIVTTNGELMTVSNPVPIELITRNQYGSYELRWEWKTSTNGNSGLEYRVNETYANSASAGPEYQLLDDLRYSLQAKQTIGAVYGLFAPTNKVLMPVGEWNKCQLILQGNHVQHWLNGNKVVEYDINSTAWTNAITAWAGASNVPGFGQGTSPGVGHILLRNDWAPTWYRNIKIRPLPAQ